MTLSALSQGTITAPAVLSGQTGNVEALTDNGVGSKQWNQRADQGSLLSSSWATRRGVLAPSELASVGRVITTATSWLVTMLQEGAAGAASALTDLDIDVLNLTEDGSSLGRVVAGGSVQFGGAAPILLVNRGFLPAIDVGGAGDITLSTDTDRGLAPDQVVIIATQRGVLAASELSAFAFDHTAAGPNLNANRDKRVTILQEGALGAASALTDLDFDFLVVERGGNRYLNDLARRRGIDELAALEVVGICGLDFPAGVPTFRFQTGEFVGAPIDNAVGDTTVTLQADRAIAADERVCIAAYDVELAPSGLVAAAVDDASPTALRITTLQEGAAGGASALTDIPLTLAVFRRLSGPA